MIKIHNGINGIEFIGVNDNSEIVTENTFVMSMSLEILERLAESHQCTFREIRGKVSFAYYSEWKDGESCITHHIIPLPEINSVKAEELWDRWCQFVIRLENGAVTKFRMV